MGHLIRRPVPNSALHEAVRGQISVRRVLGIVATPDQIRSWRTSQWPRTNVSSLLGIGRQFATCDTCAEEEQGQSGLTADSLDRYG